MLEGMKLCCILWVRPGPPWTELHGQARMAFSEHNSSLFPDTSYSWWLCV